MRSAEGALTVGKSASVCAGYVVLESALHEVVGRAAVQPDDVRPFLAAAAMSHGWRASLWETLLPVSPGLPLRRALLEEAMERLHSPLAAVRGRNGPPPPLADLLVELYRALAAEYEGRAGSVSLVSDAPLALTARRAAADLRALLIEGEGLLAGVEGAEPTAGADRERSPKVLVEALIKGLTSPLH